MTDIRDIAELDTDETTPEREAATRRSTWVSVIINVLLTVAQVLAGLMSGSQGLIADGIHSLSDLVADFVVLLAIHHSKKGPDDDHHYGHQRYENAASLVLGGLLLAVGVGMVWAAVNKLQAPETIPTVHLLALWVAMAALLVKEGLFREDLFHRLNVIRIRLPSLRERREDIPLLARHFMQKSAKELGVEAKRLSEPALKFLSGLDFQGNVRQLENLCHWLTVMAPGQQIEIGDLPAELRETVPLTLLTDWESALEGEVDRLLATSVPDVHNVLVQIFERILISRALAHTGGRRIEAALALGIGRNTITRKIAELRIDGGKEAASE